MPALEALLGRFEAANTQPLGVSVDSVHSHANWAASLGGVSFPLLADFHPKGEVAKSYGLYLEDKGITDRGTVIIDADGVVRHASSVTPAGSRDMAELAELCEKVDRAHQGHLPAAEKPAGIASGTTLFVKDGCGFSRSVLLARDNLHLQDKLPVRNVSREVAAMEELRGLTGKEQAPCLIAGGKPMFESAEIVRLLVTQAASLRA